MATMSSLNDDKVIILPPVSTQSSSGRCCRDMTESRSNQGLRMTALACGALLLMAVGARAQETAAARSREPIVGLPCEGCEAVFQGLPDSLSSAARIAPSNEPGEPLRIEGTVYDGSGRVVPGVIIYAYHTDARGIYPPDERFAGLFAYRHGRLRGWAKTDDRGRYRFDTIRPASYPERNTPAHIHMHVIEASRCTYYIESIQFDDDPLLSPDDRAAAREGRGGSGLVRPERDANDVWVVTRDILLGERVPGYSGCGRQDHQ
jgi:protocatechuate 3,4-dioxygenase beta subunit